MKEIKLTRGKAALVDDEDFEWLNQWKWYCNNGGYAMRNLPLKIAKTRGIFMHRLIMNNPVNMEIDHKDENKLNNQRYNLRLATHSQNMINKKIRKDNTSGYKGVHITSGKYILAHIRTGGKQIHLGSFIDIVSAAHAYDDAAKKYYGEFARLNFPE